MTKDFIFESDSQPNPKQPEHPARLAVELTVTCSDPYGLTVHHDIECITNCETGSLVAAVELPPDEQARLRQAAADTAWDARHDALMEFHDEYSTYLKGEQCDTER